MDSLMDLIELMGDEAFTAWSRQHRASHGGQPPTQRYIQKMLLIHAEYGPERVQRMVCAIQQPQTITPTQAGAQGTSGDGTGEVSGSSYTQFLTQSCYLLPFQNPHTAAPQPANNTAQPVPRTTIKKEEAQHEGENSQHARQAMAELEPGVLCDRSVGSIETKVPVVRRADDRRVGLRDPKWWSPAQAMALEDFIWAEEEEAAAGGRPLTNAGIARRALAQLVPAAVGNRGFEELKTKTRRARIQLSGRGRAFGHWTVEQKQALVEFVRLLEREAARAGDILHSREITCRAMAELADVLADRTFHAVYKMVKRTRMV